jgi:hypothetical protein
MVAFDQASRYAPNWTRCRCIRHIPDDVQLILDKRRTLGRSRP